MPSKRNFPGLLEAPAAELRPSCWPVSCRGVAPCFVTASDRDYFTVQCSLLMLLGIPYDGDLCQNDLIVPGPSCKSDLEPKDQTIRTSPVYRAQFGLLGSIGNAVSISAPPPLKPLLARIPPLFKNTTYTKSFTELFLSQPLPSTPSSSLGVPFRLNRGL